MVNYRLHGGSNTAVYKRDNVECIVREEVDVRWRVHALVARAGRRDLLQPCREAIARDYARRLFTGRKGTAAGLTVAGFERSIASYVERRADAALIRSRAFELLGDECYQRGEIADAREYYQLSCGASRRCGPLVKRALSGCGGPGLRVRNVSSGLKRQLRRTVTNDERPRSAVDPLRSDEASRRTDTSKGRARSGAPLVSIIVPCFNTAHFLKGALESALNQEYEPTEIIVVNDGSTDNFAEVVAPYRTRVKIIDQANAGLAAARNRGLEHSTGAIIAYLDADDQWDPRKLGCQVRILIEQPEVAFVHTAVQFIDEFDRPMPLPAPPARVLDGNCLRELITLNFVTASSVAHTRAAMASDRFEPHLTAAEDWDLWLRLAARGPIAHIDAPLTMYRTHSDNMSKRQRHMRTNELYVVARALRRTSDKDVHRTLLKKRAALYRRLAHIEYDAGNIEAARQLFWGGLPFRRSLDVIRFATSSFGLSRTRIRRIMALLALNRLGKAGAGTGVVAPRADEPAVPRGSSSREPHA
jgi:glycosyltransferase involved in cell wall biosynthesis